MEETRSFLPLLVVVLLAFIVPLVISRVRRIDIPIVVGEILVGIAIGRSGLGIVQTHDPVLDLLAEFGFAFLMFQAGLEIDFSRISLSPSASDGNTSQWGVVPLSVINFILTLLLSVAIGFSLVALDLVQNPWMMALILSTTSLGVVMPVLKETNLIRGQFGQAMMVTSLIADFTTMLLITTEVAILSHGLTLDILLVGVLFVVFFVMYRLGVVSLNRIDAVRRTLEELSQTTARIKIRGAFTILLLFVALAEVLGTELILGAFLAGAMLSLLSTKEDTEALHQLEAIGFGFFIPIFFVMVGVDFNLAAMLGSPDALLLLPLLLTAAIVVKFVPALVFRVNFSWEETMAAGVLLSARLSLIIAASAIGLQLGIISEPVNADVILVAIITVTLAPMLFTRIAPDRTEAGELPVVIVGAGELGLQVAKQLRNHHEHVVIIDSDQDRIKRARQLDLESVAAWADREDENATPYFEKANVVVSTPADPDQNYSICRYIRATFGVERVIALVSKPGQLERFEQLGATPVNPLVDQAAFIGLLVRNPAVYDLLTRTDDDKEVLEVSVRNRDYDKKPLRDLTLPGDVLVVALRRDGELMMPHGSTRLERGDRLTLAGSWEFIETARRMFTLGRNST